MKTTKKAEAKPEPKNEAKAPDSKDHSAHKRIDALEALMKRNGWTV